MPQRQVLEDEIAAGADRCEECCDKQTEVEHRRASRGSPILCYLRTELHLSGFAVPRPEMPRNACHFTAIQLPLGRGLLTHKPLVGGSNPPPATTAHSEGRRLSGAVLARGQRTSAHLAEPPVFDRFWLAEVLQSNGTARSCRFPCLAATIIATNGGSPDVIWFCRPTTPPASPSRWVMRSGSALERTWPATRAVVRSTRRCAPAATATSVHSVALPTGRSPVSSPRCAVASSTTPLTEFVTCRFLWPLDERPRMSDGTPI